jgi:hypothetical protein
MYSFPGDACRLVALAVCLAIPVFAAAAEPVSISLTQDVVRVASRPGSTIAILSVAQEPFNSAWRLVARRELLPDDDDDGSFVYRPEHGVSFRSIWIAIDVQTGAVAHALPAGYIAEEMHERAAGRGRAVEVATNTLDVSRDRVEFLLVRPGEGAWTLSAREGGADDRDGLSNGRLRLNLPRLRALGPGNGGPPDALREGDVVAVLDANRMQYWYRTISREEGR